MSSKATRVLAGDIGGTKTRLAICEVAGTQLQTLVEHSYPSQHYAALEDVIDDFLGAHEHRPQAACFGVAGPVRDAESRITNLPWHISAAAIAERFRLRRASLLNDLEATAWGIQALGERDFHNLNTGSVHAAGNAAVIAAGTGLGEAGLCRSGNRLVPFATEGGHTDFSPGNELEIELLRYLKTRHEHVSWERIVSGPGLVMLHAFLCRQHATAAPDWLQTEMQCGDPAAAISRAAQSGRDTCCVAALELFVHLYGVEAGNLALKIMATGGFYIGGGIAPKILAELAGGGFMAAFTRKGRMQALLEQMPVRVILNDRTALLGPALVAAAAG
ncbi:MAG TPA: glucokinase [Gammaproteobacteria bacterium]|nr:glucokinase [Gammaproteobacteria bacterium]